MPPAAELYAENLALNSVNQLANPVFNLTLGVSPVLVGLALALPRREQIDEAAAHGVLAGADHLRDVGVARQREL